MLLLWLFLGANYAVQTHIHGAFVHSEPGFETAAVSVPGPADAPDQDENHCSLCQEFLSGGHFLLPALLLLLVPTVAGLAYLPVAAPALTRTSSYCWLGRGPPVA